MDTVTQRGLGIGRLQDIGHSASTDTKEAESTRFLYCENRGRANQESPEEIGEDKHFDESQMGIGGETSSKKESDATK